MDLEDAKKYNLTDGHLIDCAYKEIALLAPWSPVKLRATSCHWGGGPT